MPLFYFGTQGTTPPTGVLPQAPTNTHTFVSEAARDSYFPSHLSELVVGRLIFVTIAGTVHLQMWAGPASPVSYDNTLWADSGNVTLTGAQIRTMLAAEPDTNIFDDAASNKLGGIAAGAEVNVQSDYTELLNTEDDFILNKPDLTQDLINAQELTEDVITFTRRDATTFALTLATSQSYAAPSVHNLSVAIASRVDLNTDLNVATNITYDVTNRNNISSLLLIVTVGDNKTVTVPTSDGTITESITFTGIDSSVQGSVTFQLQATDTQANTHLSNIVTVQIRTLVTPELVHFGFILSTEDQNDIDFGADDRETRATPEGNWTVSGIPSDSNLYRIYMAVPSAQGSITSVTQSAFNITNQFTNFTNVTISGNPYNVFLMNAASAVNSNYNGTVLTFA